MGLRNFAVRNFINSYSHSEHSYSCLLNLPASTLIILWASTIRSPQSYISKTSLSPPPFHLYFPLSWLRISALVPPKQHTISMFPPQNPYEKLSPTLFIKLYLIFPLCKSWNCNNTIHVFWFHFLKYKFYICIHTKKKPRSKINNNNK